MLLTLVFTASILVLEIFTCYRVYAQILKWLALSLLSYPITVFIVHEPWIALLKATLIPHIEFSFAFLFIIVGVLGTTISPYMFFWEANQEVEEEREEHIAKKNGKPNIDWKHIKMMRLDNLLGMVISEIATWCIIVSAATVLHSHGVNNINTSTDAAKALQPLVHSFPNSGYFTKLIFAVGIIGLGILAIPVLSSSASYAVSEAFNWKTGFNLKFKRAHGFYGVITIATLIGLVINFIGIDPMKALVITAVINGIVAAPLLFLIIKITNNHTIMGKYKSGKLSNIFLWITFWSMGIASIALLFTMGQK